MVDLKIQSELLIYSATVPTLVARLLLDCRKMLLGTVYGCEKEVEKVVARTESNDAFLPFVIIIHYCDWRQNVYEFGQRGCMLSDAVSESGQP